MKDTPFTEARLLSLYDRVAEAEDAIPRLRRFVLDLAVRGKLVPQEVGDEPASVLLERIDNEKARLRTARRPRPTTQTGIVHQAEANQWAVPDGWLVTTLGRIAEKITDGTHKTPVYVARGVPFVSVKDFSGGRLELTNTRFITQEEHRTLIQRCDPRRGDILIGRIGTLGRAVIVDTDVEFSLFVSVGLIRVSHENLFAEYLRLALNSPFVEAEFDSIKIGGGTHTNKLNLGDLETVAIPLPPLAEQHRIVAKVEELMALLDRLEAARAAREETRPRLTAATLSRLTEADTHTPAAARFALQILPALTTRPDQIKTLRQTILNLAVRGKLVAQDAGDETASDLLLRIAADKAARSASAKDRRAKTVVALLEDAGGYHVPPSWVWARFGDITISRDGERVPVSREERETRAKIYDYYGASGVIDKIDGYLFEKPLLLIGEDGANLINRSTPIAFMARGKYWVNNHAHVIDGLDEDYLKFMELFINAIDLKPYVTGTAQPKMNQAKMNSIPVALPPLAEQRRIVAKVEELMSLCDRLERALQDASTTRARLLDATLREALAGAQGAA